ncbi:MAG: carbohydrate ABC transporter permease [Deinococcus sp.]|nr:carbohydrate ABC transporter permease [Deinococcus sp.]
MARIALDRSVASPGGILRRLTWSRALLAVRYLLLLALALGFLIPLYWMFTGAFKTQGSSFAVPPEWFPKRPTLANFELLFTRHPTVRWFANSMVVAAGTVFLTLLFSSLAGYSFAKKRFPGQQALFWILLATMMMPRQVTLVPLFILMRQLELFNTYLALILPLVSWPFGVFLLRQFIQSLPTELFDAARIDGAGEVGLWWHIVMPLSRPALGSLAIFTFVASWNDFFWQVVVTRTDTMRTLPVGLTRVAEQEFGVNLGIVMAGAVLTSLPLFAMFFAFQNYFIKGITMGAVKG